MKSSLNKSLIYTTRWSRVLTASYYDSGFYERSSIYLYDGGWQTSILCRQKSATSLSIQIPVHVSSDYDCFSSESQSTLVHQDMPVVEAEDTMLPQAHITPDLGSSEVKWSMGLQALQSRFQSADFI